MEGYFIWICFYNVSLFCAINWKVGPKLRADQNNRMFVKDICHIAKGQEKEFYHNVGIFTKSQAGRGLEKFHTMQWNKNIIFWDCTLNAYFSKYSNTMTHIRWYPVKELGSEINRIFGQGNFFLHFLLDNVPLIISNRTWQIVIDSLFQTRPLIKQKMAMAHLLIKMKTLAVYTTGCERREVEALIFF